jgi:hypothetical protein
MNLTTQDEQVACFQNVPRTSSRRLLRDRGRRPDLQRLPPGETVPPLHVSRPGGLRTTVRTSQRRGLISQTHLHVRSTAGRSGNSRSSGACSRLRVWPAELDLIGPHRTALRAPATAGSIGPASPVTNVSPQARLRLGSARRPEAAAQRAPPRVVVEAPGSLVPRGGRRPPSASAERHARPSRSTTCRCSAPPAESCPPGNAGESRSSRAFASGGDRVDVPRARSKSRKKSATPQIQHPRTGPEEPQSCVTSGRPRLDVDG